MTLAWNQLEQLLTIPGEGLYTVSTGADLKQKLHQSQFPNLTIEQIKNKWISNLNLFQQENIYLLGIPSDNGGGIHRGANWGPLYLRLELLQHNQLSQFADLGDIRVIPHLLHDKYLNNQTISECQQALFGKSNSLPVSPLSIAQKVAEIVYHNNSAAKIFSLGGDHSVSFPMVKAWLKKKKEQQIKTAIIHFDAHTDLLDKRLGIDLCFGTWAYHILEDLNKPSDLIQIGIRASGKDKAHWQSTLGVQQFWAKEVKQLGAQKISEHIERYIKQEKIDEVYITFDIDALDSNYASATGTPEHDGIYPHDAAIIIQGLEDCVKVSGGDLVEVAPKVTGSGSTHQGQEPSSTLRWGREMIQQITNLMKK